MSSLPDRVDVPQATRVTIEDISIEAIVFGVPSRESSQSLRNWLERRNR